MRFYLVWVGLFLWCPFVFSQQDIELIDVKQENEVLIYAKNNRSEEVEITLSADIKGYTSSVSLPYTMKIAAKSKEKVLTLTLITQEREHGYQFSVSYNVLGRYTIKDAVNTSNQTNKIEIDTSVIYVFSKNGCGRCAFVTKFLKDNNIEYIELNTTTQYTNNKFMFDQLEQAGFKGGSVTMPVILYKNKVHYNIPDLNILMKSLQTDKR